VQPAQRGTAHPLIAHPSIFLTFHLSTLLPFIRCGFPISFAEGNIHFLKQTFVKVRHLDIYSSGPYPSSKALSTKPKTSLPSDLGYREVVNRPATGVITRCSEWPYVNSTSTVLWEVPGATRVAYPMLEATATLGRHIAQRSHPPDHENLPARRCTPRREIFGSGHGFPVMRLPLAMNRIKESKDRRTKGSTSPCRLSRQGMMLPLRVVIIFVSEPPKRRRRYCGRARPLCHRGCRRSRQWNHP